MPGKLTNQRVLTFVATDVKYKKDALEILALDPRNKLGLGSTVDEVFESLREKRNNGENYVLVSTGVDSPVALLKDNGSDKSELVCYSSNAPIDSEYMDAIYNCFDEFKDPEGYKLKAQLKSIVSYFENTGIDPTRWKKDVSFDDLPTSQYEKRLVESFADEVVLAHKGKVVDPETLAKTLNSYSNKEGMEVYWNKLGDVCGQYLMLNSLLQQQKEGSTLSGKVKNWISEQKQVGLEDGERLSQSFEKNVLDNLGNNSQSMLKKLVDVFEAIGRALGKSLDAITDKLAKACGAIGNSLGLDGKAIEYSVSDGFTEMRDGAKEMAEKLKNELKNPAFAGLAAAATVTAMPVLEKLNQIGLNPSNMLHPQSGEAQVYTLGVAAVAMALSPLALKVQEWSKKPQSIKPDYQEMA
jgi:hypothetical protein